MGSCCCKKGTAVIHPQGKTGSSKDPLFKAVDSDEESESMDSPPASRESSLTRASTHVSISTIDPLKMIDGYEYEPVLSLEDSLKPFDGKIDKLSAQINEAKSKCHYPSEHHLTRDESAAFYLYSIRGDRNSVHSQLQRAWQSGNRAQMKPWIKYLKLVKSGTDKLPNAKTEAWQGMSYNEEWDKTLQSDSSSLYTGMGLCPISANTIKDELNVKAGSKTILLGCESVQAKDVTGYTDSAEKEVLLWPGVRLSKARNADIDRNGSLTIHLTGEETSIKRGQTGICATDPLKLIDGYQNEPIVSLEDSLKPLDGKIDQLPAQIKEAKTKCHYPSEHNLTRDESAALYLYSIRGDQSSVHSQLQRAWQSGDRVQMKTWLKYLKLMKSGSDKLPNAKTDAWQGMPYDEEWDKTLQSDSATLYTGMSLCPASSNDAKDELNVKPGTKTILVACESVQAKDTSGYTADNERQLLVWPGVHLSKARNAETDRIGSLTVHLTGRNHSDKGGQVLKNGNSSEYQSNEDGAADPAGISNSDPLKLIDGYRNEPVVSLEESFKPLDGKIDKLAAQIREAKTKCHYPSEHNLTRDESAALYLYSIRGDPNSVHSQLQRAWQSGDRVQMKPWFKYLKLLKSGTDKLPNAKTEAWQGMLYDEEWDRKLQSDSSSLYTGMGLYPMSAKTAKDDLKVNPGSKVILVGCESVHAKDATGYIASDEEEVMVWPGVRLSKARNAEISRSGSLKAHLTGKNNSINPQQTPRKLVRSDRTPKEDDVRDRQSSKEKLYGSRLSKNTTPESHASKEEIPEKHFVCPVRACKNRCRGTHDANHCKGYSLVFRTFTHHCGPIPTCFRCNEPIPGSFECHMCRGRFCEDCCFE